MIEDKASVNTILENMGAQPRIHYIMLQPDNVIVTIKGVIIIIGQKQPVLLRQLEK